MRAALPRGQAGRWLDAWAKMLDGPVEDVMEALTSRSPRSRELRQTARSLASGRAERLQVLESYASVRHVIGR